MNGKTDRWGRVLFAAVIVLTALAIFRGVLAPDRFLFTTDDNIGDLALRKALLPAGYAGAWYDGMLMGFNMVIPPGWTHLLLWLLPLRAFVNWIHGLDLVLASLALAAFLRRRALGWPACALAALAAFWVGSNFTLTYAGHVMKFGILFWAAAYLWLVEHAAESGRPAWGVLAGGALGAMFMEQADVALFFAMVLGPYALLRIGQEAGTQWKRWASVLGPLLLTAGLISFHPMWEGYRANVQGVVSMEENPAEKWAFVTQWSWPPDESVDFVAPGYMGWRSGEPAGPYWGRMGRSDEWETTRRGFQNFKLENQYLGAIPVVMALAAVLGLALGGARRAELVFWSIAALVTLLLSFGKYFPLYAAFYQLPVVNSIRNPNKFLQVFQLVLGILAAYGLDRVLSLRSETQDGKQ